jgi:ribulose 1,5-bisphosphate carboxylase large subunit-like protein
MDDRSRPGKAIGPPRLGLKDKFAHGASKPYLMKKYGRDAMALAQTVFDLIGSDLGITDEDLTEAQLDAVHCHPYFSSIVITNPDGGFSHNAFHGQLHRLAGADAVIYPNFSGRFSFSRGECQGIVTNCPEAMGQLTPIFPTPGGDMSLQSVPGWRAMYSSEVIYLIGAGLRSHSRDLTANVRYFNQLVSLEAT